MSDRDSVSCRLDPALVPLVEESRHSGLWTTNRSPIKGSRRIEGVFLYGDPGGPSNVCRTSSPIVPIVPQKRGSEGRRKRDLILDRRTRGTLVVYTLIQGPTDEIL